MTDTYESLANAIILQAAKDYRAAKKKLKYRPKNKDAKLIIEDCERFFRSDWFAALTSVSGELLIKNFRRKKSHDTKRVSTPGISLGSENK